MIYKKYITIMSLFLGLQLYPIDMISQLSPVPTGFEISTVAYEEDFESGVPLGWTNIVLDQAKLSSINNGWVVDRDTTFTSGTGPAMAQSGDFYAYCDGSSPIGRGVLAATTTAAIDLTGATAPALIFHLNMHGRAGSFYVNIVDGMDRTQVLSPVDGDIPGGVHDPDTWEEIFIDLSAYVDRSVQIEFVTMKPSIPNTGDVAIDNVRVVSSVVTAIPTLGQWSLISLMLLLMIFTAVALQYKSDSTLAS